MTTKVTILNHQFTGIFSASSEKAWILDTDAMLAWAMTHLMPFLLNGYKKDGLDPQFQNLMRS